jgi:positive regulator of sigma E activity
MSSFSTYLIGYFIFIIGLAVAAYLLHVQAQWIGVGALILIGLGILTAAKSTKPRDPPH